MSQPILPQQQWQYPELPPSPVPPTKPKAGKYLAIGCGSLIALVLLLLALTAIASSGHSTTPTDTSSTAIPTDTPVPTQPTTAQQVASWNNQYGSIIQTLSSDLTAISGDGTDSAKMNADCTQLQTDVNTAQSDPPIPDAQTENAWSNALTDLASASTDCINGTNNEDASLLYKAASEFTQANTQFSAAAADLQAIHP